MSMNMYIENDLAEIKRLSAMKEDDNWGFRSFLKCGEIPSSRIDSIVHRLSKKVARKIDCIACRNCCKEISPPITDSDIDSLAAGLQLSRIDIINKYLIPDEYGYSYEFKQRPCPFLQNGQCTVEKFKPQGCRTFPNLDKKKFVSRTISIIHQCSICPIVFNVFENLKDQIWSEDDYDESS